MIVTIILLAFLVGGILLLRTYDYDILGITITLVTAIILLIHIPAILLAGYEYEIFVEKRNAFQNTLDESRVNGNELETAAIVKEVAQWNVDLASRKYNNTTWFLDQYYDDRIMDLEPIK